MKKQYFLIALGGIVLFIFFGYYFYKPQISVDEKYSLATESFYSGNSEKAISQFENVLKSPPSKEIEASAKIFLAISYLGKDLEKSISLLKEVAENESYPSENRARALVSMANAFMLGSRESDKLAKYIFSGEPYDAFPSTISSSNSYLLGVRRIYEHASDIYIFPIAEYRIAEWYVKQATVSKLYNIKTTRAPEVYIAQAKDHLKKGDETLITFGNRAGNELSVAYARYVKGIVLGVLSEIDKNNFDKDDANKSFETSLDFLDGENRFGIYATDHRLWANFAYAGFLNRTYGRAREGDIKKSTAFISDPRNRFFDEKNNLY